MKNTVYFIIIAACVGAISFGLIKKNAPQSLQFLSLSTQDAAPSAAPQTAATSTLVAIGQNVKQRYRPDAVAPVTAGAPTTAAQDAERNFQVTPALLAQMYLADTYKPGICYGAPIAAPQAAITSLINYNPPLSNFLKQKYGLAADLEIYNKLKQVQGITLVETASSRYNFSFMDGQCRTVTYYEGAVTVSGDGSASASVNSQTSHTYE